MRSITPLSVIDLSPVIGSHDQREAIKRLQIKYNWRAWTGYSPRASCAFSPRKSLGTGCSQHNLRWQLSLMKKTKIKSYGYFILVRNRYIRVAQSPSESLTKEEILEQLTNDEVQKWFTLTSPDELIDAEFDVDPSKEPEFKSAEELRKYLQEAVAEGRFEVWEV